MILTLGLTPAYQRTMIFERVALGAVNRAADVRHAASGKSVNAARVLRTLGRDVVTIGLLGGLTGQFMREDLDAAGIRHDFVEVAAATRTCVTMVDRSAGSATELVEEAGAVPPDACREVIKRLQERLPGASVAILSGSLPPGVPSDFYRQCVHRINSAGAMTLLDARGEEMLEALSERPTVVKPNRRELAGTFGIDAGDEGAIRAAMGAIIQRGARWVVMTMGRDGALLTDGEQFSRAHLPAIRAVNPIGSGDALAAGLAAGLADGRSVPDAARLGVACAAANVMSEQAGFIDAGILAELESRVMIESLK